MTLNRPPSSSSLHGVLPGKTYGSFSAAPLTLTGPSPAHSTVSPATPMTRLMRSFSSAEGITPMKLSTFCTVFGSSTGTSPSQSAGSWKTTTSPRSGSDPNQGVSLSTRTRSPFCRVFCMESEGMENACRRKVLMSRASTSAIPTRSGSSTQNGRFFRAFDRRVLARPIAPLLAPRTTRPFLGERIR
ncbi:hypothetical protein SCALM49S_07655 [Streptomyces californicus]